MSGNNGGGGGGCDGGGGGGSPCGACKFLRRKCVKGCVFAPYFDPEQGTTHFAAVHKVFGASNASKILLRIPVHKRLDAAVTLCYEALARVKDPVYGCVSHIFTLQHQVVNLQAELAYIQARLSTLHHLPLHSSSLSELGSTSSDNMVSTSSILSHFDTLQHQHQQQQKTTIEHVSFYDTLEQQMQQDGDLHAMARELASRYLSEVKFKPSTPN